MKELKSGQCDGKASPTIVKETPGTAYVDGHNAMGTVSTIKYLSVFYKCL